MLTSVTNLAEALHETGYGINDLLGNAFAFVTEYNSHRYEMTGTITAITWSDQDGLRLQTSVLTLMNAPLLGIVYRRKGWGALIKTEHTKERGFFAGTFQPQ